MQANKQPGLIMPAAFSTKELKESLFYRYGFFDDNNQLQILMPLTSGETIGLDNTCQAALALKEFFGLVLASDRYPNPVSVFDCLRTMKRDLTLDIDTLQTTLETRDSKISQNSNQKTKDILAQKQQRKEDVDRYLHVFNKVINHQITTNDNVTTNLIESKLNISYPLYFDGIHQLLESNHSNAHIIQLRPEISDVNTRLKTHLSTSHFNRPVNNNGVETDRPSPFHDMASQLHQSLEENKGSTHNKYCIEHCLVRWVKAKLSENPPSKDSEDSLFRACQKQLMDYFDKIYPDEKIDIYKQQDGSENTYQCHKNNGLLEKDSNIDEHVSCIMLSCNYNYKRDFKLLTPSPKAQADTQLSKFIPKIDVFRDMLFDSDKNFGSKLSFSRLVLHCTH